MVRERLSLILKPHIYLRRWREPSDRTTTYNFDADQTRLGSGGWLGLGPFGHPLLGLVSQSHTQTHGVEGARQQRRGRPNERNERTSVRAETPMEECRSILADDDDDAAKYAGVEEGAWRRRLEGGREGARSRTRRAMWMPMERGEETGGVVSHKSEVEFIQSSSPPSFNGAVK